MSIWHMSWQMTQAMRSGSFEPTRKEMLNIGPLCLQDQLRRSREWRRQPGPRMEVQEGSCRSHWRQSRLGRAILAQLTVGSSGKSLPQELPEAVSFLPVGSEGQWHIVCGWYCSKPRESVAQVVVGATCQGQHVVSKVDYKGKKWASLNVKGQIQNNSATLQRDVDSQGLPW